MDNSKEDVAYGNYADLLYFQHEYPQLLPLALSYYVRYAFVLEEKTKVNYEYFATGVIAVLVIMLFSGEKNGALPF